MYKLSDVFDSYPNWILNEDKINKLYDKLEEVLQVFEKEHKKQKRDNLPFYYLELKEIISIKRKLYKYSIIKYGEHNIKDLNNYRNLEEANKAKDEIQKILLK